MAIVFRCENCGHRYNVLDHMAGKRVRCKDCGQAITVPLPQQPTARKVGAGAPRQGAEGKSGQSSTSFKAIVDPLNDAARSGAKMLKQPILRPLSESKDSEPYDLEENDPSVGRESLLKRLFRRVGWTGLTSLVVLAALAGSLTLFGRQLAEIVGVVSHTAPEFGTWTSVVSMPRPRFPELPAMQPLAENIGSYQLSLAGKAGPGQGMQLRIYMPLGTHEPRSLPCVLIAASGITPLAGASLSSDDNDVHLAYARKGFVVVYYELDGAPSGDVRKMNSEAVQAIRRFLDSRAGLVNARNALEYVVARLPQVDPERIYCAGEGPAGTTALLFAAMSGRIRACMVYGPICDIPGFVDTRLMQSVERKIAGAKQFLSQASPSSHMTDLRCPTYIFCAEDDNQVAFADVRSLAEELKNAGKQVEFVSTPTGGHRDAMMAKGIPDAVQWLRGVRPAAAKGGVLPEELVFQDPPAEPIWLPDPRVVDRLASEVSIGGYRIRPPRGLTLSRAEDPRAHLRWQAESGGGEAWFAVRIVPGKNPFQRQPWIITNGQPGPFDHLYSIIAPAAAIEQGRVGEISFTGAIWREADEQDRKFQRLEYAGLDGGNWIIIQGCCAENDEEMLPVLKAAAKTFRKPLASEPYIDPMDAQ